ncbi:hypothetical protein [Neptunicella sp. SCSIO 80796]|uniref:hypothetical protein n=1 Tax=Neptunicella plasticusilytica TaxID=3117012 RepID=UPI003A4DD61D
MDETYIAENDIKRRYLHNKLTAEETAEFEAYILDKPALLEELELDSVFISAYPNMMKKSPFWRSLTDKWLWPGLGVAIGGALSAAIILIAFIPQTSFELSKQSPEIVYLETMRSVSGRTSVRFLPSQEEKLLVIDTGLRAREHVNLILENESGTVKNNWSSITTNSNGELIVMLVKTRLIGGNYRMTVTPLGSKEPVFSVPVSIEISN